MQLPVSPRLVRGLFLCMSCLFAQNLGARVWTPPSDDTPVLELEPRPAPINAAADSWPMERALTAAEAHLEQLRRSGNPRHYEAIQLLTQPWLETPSAAPVLLARAQQHQHRFDAALQILQQHPADTQHQAEAALLEAAILRLLGHYSNALQACERIRANSPERLLCEWPVRSLTGELDAAIHQLTQLRPAQLDSTLRRWRHSEMAEMHERAGKDEAALRHWLSALQFDSRDPFIATATADLLIRTGRADTALQVLEPLPSLDPVLIRRTQAARSLGRGDADKLAEQIWQRLQLADQVHGKAHPRELTQTALILGRDQEALEWARRNWTLQKEPLDARLLVIAAHAAGQPDDTAVVRRWQQETGLQDVRLSNMPSGDQP